MGVLNYSLGTFNLLLTIPHPHIKNINVERWTWRHVPSPQTPSGKPSLPSCHPLHKHTPIVATSPSVVGMGSPSKYLDLPDMSLGNDAAVTLNLARRDNPESKKNARIKVSTVVLIPKVYAKTEGATPNDT